MRISKKLLAAVRAEVPEIEEHELRAIVSCLAGTPTERGRRFDAESSVLMRVRGLGGQRARYFKSAESYQRWQNRQPDIGGWQWDVLPERLAGKRPFPGASRK